MFFKRESSPIQGETVEVRFGNSAVFEFDNLLDKHPYLDTEANKRLIKAARTAFGISINKVFRLILDQVDLARRESGDQYWDENFIIGLELDYEEEERPLRVTFTPTAKKTVRVDREDAEMVENEQVCAIVHFSDGEKHKIVVPKEELAN